jgi:Cytochrome P460
MRTLFYFGIFILGISFIGCKHERDTDPLDSDLLDLARRGSDDTWYKENADLLPRSAGSGHAQALLRTRFNPTAAAMLDTNGQVLPNTVFPDGSVIVKELWDDNSTLSLYALLYKKPDHQYADADGWVWGYVRPSGEVVESASNLGAACRDCHSGNGNIDFSLMNVSFP